jgi:hypothetical protein
MSECQGCAREEEKPLEFPECDSCGETFCFNCLCEVSAEEVADYEIDVRPEAKEDALDRTEDGASVVFLICMECHPGYCGDDFPE